MKWKGWERVPLRIPDAKNRSETVQVDAIAPLIISASRSTDIPAFFGDWFMDRQKKGYVKWRSPFGGAPVYISFSKARVYVFWSKNPEPFFPHLDTLDQTGRRYYFLFTLNDYGNEGLEPNVPPVDKRMRTFIRLSRRIGKGKVVWRYDPLILSDMISVDDLLEKIRHIGNRLHPYTKGLVISFVDIARYKKVRRNLETGGLGGVREFTEKEVLEFSKGLKSLNQEWGLAITACGERRDLSAYNIGRGQCVNVDLMVQEFSDDELLMEFLRPDVQQPLLAKVRLRVYSSHLKDPGQRSTCGCIVSKDIGQYNTCMHLCAYCYANVSAASVHRNYRRYCETASCGIFAETIIE